jgi:putative hydrolase of the HAD superfamily
MSTLEQLRLKYRFAVITNTQGQVNSGGHRFGRFPDMEKFFDRIIVAWQSGVPPKPDPFPFRLCLEGPGVLPEDAVYVGDDLQIDIYGAIAVGIHPDWIKHYSVQRSWPDAEVHFQVITSLNQLLLMDRMIFGV